MDHAWRLAHETGLEGVTLGTLATEAKLSKSGLFAHFKSKEALQLAVLESAVERFRTAVILPAMAAERGEPRLRALFKAWLDWVEGYQQPGGCLFMRMNQEYDDRPGPIRDALVESQQDWRTFIERTVKAAVESGFLRRECDTTQFAFEMQGIGFALKPARRLLGDELARQRAMQAFEALVQRERAAA